MNKAVFKFNKDGKLYIDPDLGEWDEEFTKKMMEARDKHYSSQKPRERAWRNSELAETDWMLVADATFGGEPLAGSDRLDEVIEYRHALREYNLTTDDRPAKPTWL